MPDSRQDYTAQSASTGSLRLLCDCLKVEAGQSLLVVGESAAAGYYDEEAAESVAAEASGLGLDVTRLTVAPGLETVKDQEALLAAIKGYDHVVFFARAGDQIRFSSDLAGQSIAMSYALDLEMLESNFAAASYHGLCRLRDTIDAFIAEASEIRVTCPRGSDYAGAPVKQTDRAAGPAEVTVRRFPMLIVKPVTAAGFRGRVALSRFLAGTGSRFYQPYALSLQDDVFALVENNRIVEFEGPKHAVSQIEAHYRDIAERYDLDPWFLHSWHAGIHPASNYTQPAAAHYERWSGGAFGSPRILHFHTCGDYAPGEISWTLVDATVSIDGIAVWQAGRLHPERVPGASEVLTDEPELAALYAQPCRGIGIED